MLFAFPGTATTQPIDQDYHLPTAREPLTSEQQQQQVVASVIPQWALDDHKQQQERAEQARQDELFARSLQEAEDAVVARPAEQQQTLISGKFEHIISRVSDPTDRLKVERFLAFQETALLSFSEASSQSSSDVARATEQQKQEEVSDGPACCQCCYNELTATAGDNDSSALAQCNHGVHQFCSDCVAHYTQAFAFGEPYPLRQEPATAFRVLPCLSSDCADDGYIPHGVIEKHCSAPVWKAYQEKIFTNSPTEPSNLKQPPSEIVSAASRRQNRKKNRGYHRIEEALTEAKVRRCPNCATPFLKEAGYCNKLRCPSCSTAVCYICTQAVPSRGYDHFCNHGYDVCPENCGKCVLWTTQDEAIDANYLRQVGTQEAHQMWLDQQQQQQENASKKKKRRSQLSDSSSLSSNSLQSSVSGCSSRSSGAKKPTPLPELFSRVERFLEN